MKIIDIKKKGNVVRFILGKDELTDWCGDDWDDTPYEHNCGEVYEEYIAGYADVSFPYDYSICEPADDWRCDNTPYSRDDFRKRKVPCLIIAPLPEGSDYNNDSYFDLLNRDDSKRVYFGDSDKTIEELGGVSIWFHSHEHE